MLLSTDELRFCSQTNMMLRGPLILTRAMGSFLFHAATLVVVRQTWVGALKIQILSRHHGATLYAIIVRFPGF